MKILITTDLFTTATNGVVTSVKNLFDELKRKGHDVRILTLSESAHSYKDKFVYYIRSMPAGVYPNVRMPLSYRHNYIKELIQWKPDVIHSQCEIFSMQYAKRISELTGAPIVHTYHTMYEQYVGYVVPGKRFGKWLVRYLTHKRLQKVSMVIVPTSKMESVLTGYDLDNNLGRLGMEKNIEELLYLFAKARAANERLVLLIVGDGPAREQLEREAEQLGITDYVIFTGMVEPSEVQNYYQLGDVFVSASTSETQGLTYIEAAVNGLPLLCRQDLCLTDVIVQGENGYAYECEDEFLKALSMIFDDAEWRANAGRKSEEIASVYSKAEFGNAVEEAYKWAIQ